MSTNERMMKSTTTLLAILLLAPLSAGAATDPSTTLRFNTPARTFHESLPLGNGRQGGDPPVYLSYSAPPALGQPQKDPTHTATFGVKLQEKCNAIGVSCELVYPGAQGVKHSTPQDYLIATLKGKRE